MSDTFTLYGSNITNVWQKNLMKMTFGHSLVKLCMKNYENLSIFVKVMAKKSVAPFYVDMVYNIQTKPSFFRTEPNQTEIPKLKNLFCTSLIYTLCLKKESHLMLDNDFGKCELIFEILSPTDLVLVPPPFCFQKSTDKNCY